MKLKTLRKVVKNEVRKGPSTLREMSGGWEDIKKREMLAGNSTCALSTHE